MIGLAMTGGPELRYVAGLLRKAAVKDLKAEMRKGQRKAFAPLEKDIKLEAAAALPGMYAGIMAKAVKVSVRTGFATSVFSVRIYARGRAELRDVRAVNAGRVRHPLFGNRRRWYTTRVRPGFVDRPVNRNWDRVVDESADAVGRVLLQIAKG